MYMYTLYIVQYSNNIMNLLIIVSHSTKWITYVSTAAKNQSELK